MKITHIIIEGFHNAVKDEYWFEDINYLYGRNGAGKSTILQAIQLGLLGYVPGSNKTKQGVFAHSSNHTMAVKLELDNGVSIQRVWTKSKNSVSESVTVVPEGYDIQSLVADVELPLFNFDEFTHMTANTLKDWFINYLPKQSFTTDWSSVLKDALSDLPDASVEDEFVSEAVEAIKGFGVSGVEEIRQANTYFKNLLSFTKKELDKKLSTIQSLIHYDDYEAMYSEDELRLRIKEIENKILQLHLQKQSADKLESITSEINRLNSLTPEIDALQEEVNRLQNRVTSLEKEIADKRSQYSEQFALAKSYDSIIESNGVCTFTGRKCNEISALVENYKVTRQQCMESAHVIREETDQLLNAKNIYDTDLRNKSNQLYSMKRDLSLLPHLEDDAKSLQDTVANIIEEDVVTLEDSLEKYKEMYGKAVANREYNDLNSAVIADKYRLENEVECLKIWVKLTDVNGLQAQGDYNPFDILSSSINPVLSKLFDSKVSCMFYSDGKANSFSFGLNRVGTYIPYTMLSSGEKCMFLLSMFIGLLNYTKSSLKLILIDDFLDHLDDENFDSVLEAIRNMNGIQFIFAGVKPAIREKINTIEL